MTSKRLLFILASAVPVTAGAMSPPPAGDFLKLLLAKDIQGQGAGGALARADHDYARSLLVALDSPYDDVSTWAPAQNELAWQDARALLATTSGPLSDAQALAMQQWDLGFTKSRPGKEVPAVPVAFRDSFIGASAVKAGVEPDIFWKAIELAPAGRYTVAANYAVAAQMLRERLAAVPAEAYRDQGLRPDVLERFMHAEAARRLTDYDMLYLSRIVEGARSRWEAGALSVYGYRQLPIVFRVARVAAAYRDHIGSFASFPCRADGSANPGTAGTLADGDTRVMCFVDAQDRAVYRWYIREHHRQLNQRRPEVTEPSTAARLFGFIADALALIGLPELELASAVEVAESRMVRQLAAEDVVGIESTEVAGNRALSLSCKAL